MNPIKHFNERGEFLNVWHCGTCRVVWSDLGMAEQCCDRHCEDCKTILPPTKKHCWTVCDPCRGKREENREVDRFGKAEKIHRANWGGWVFHNDNFYPCVDDLLDVLDCNGDDIPVYAWACKSSPIVNKDCLEHLFHCIEGEAYEDFSVDELAGLPELREAFVVFMSANADRLTYEPDYTKAILLGWVKPLENS